MDRFRCRDEPEFDRRKVERNQGARRATALPQRHPGRFSVGRTKVGGNTRVFSQDGPRRKFFAGTAPRSARSRLSDIPSGARTRIFRFETSLLAHDCQTIWPVSKSLSSGLAMAEEVVRHFWVRRRLVPDQQRLDANARLAGPRHRAERSHGGDEKRLDRRDARTVAPSVIPAISSQKRKLEQRRSFH
jgi:hypothetical protein